MENRFHSRGTHDGRRETESLMIKVTSMRKFINQITSKVLDQQTNWETEGDPFAVFSSIPIYHLKNLIGSLLHYR